MFHPIKFAPTIAVDIFYKASVCERLEYMHLKPLSYAMKLYFSFG